MKISQQLEVSRIHESQENITGDSKLSQCIKHWKVTFTDFQLSFLMKFYNHSTGRTLWFWDCFIFHSQSSLWFQEPTISFIWGPCGCDAMPQWYRGKSWVSPWSASPTLTRPVNSGFRSFPFWELGVLDDDISGPFNKRVGFGLSPFLLFDPPTWPKLNPTPLIDCESVTPPSNPTWSDKYWGWPYNFCIRFRLG